MGQGYYASAEEGTHGGGEGQGEGEATLTPRGEQESSAGVILKLQQSRIMRVLYEQRRKEELIPLLETRATDTTTGKRGLVELQGGRDK